MGGVQDGMAGRWGDFLLRAGVSREHLCNKQGPCPMCGGKTRFRFDDKGGRGTWICNYCGAGTGYKLAMLATGWDKERLNREIRGFLSGWNGASSRPASSRPKPSPAATQDLRVAKLLRESQPLDGFDPASDYLENRGLRVPRDTVLLWHPAVSYWQDGHVTGEYAAMLAPVTTLNGAITTAHVTYLAEGRKADVPSPRKILSSCGEGACIRLMPRGPGIGVAEGIETALAAWQLFGVPTWAAISAGGLERWEPAGPTKEVVIYGDNDESMTGQAAAFALAKRLRARGLVVTVRIPEQRGDWLDVLNARREAKDER